jgi:PST family polysaccharide transporter
MNMGQLIAKGTVWSAIERWGTQGVSFLTFVLLARLLGPEAYGMVSMAVVFTGIVRVALGQEGWAQVVVQHRELTPLHIDTAFWFVVVLSAILTAGMMALAPVIAAIYGVPEVEPLVIWLSLSLPLDALAAIQIGLLRRSLKFRLIGLRSIIAILASSALAVVMAFTGWGVWSLVALQLGQAAISALLLWWVSDWRPRLAYSRAAFRDLRAYGFSIAGIRLVGFLGINATRFLVGFFLGAAPLGILSFALRLVETATQLLVYPLTKVVMPAISRVQTDPEGVRRIYRNAIQMSSFLLFPAVIGLAVLTPDLVPLVLGQAWTDGIPMLQILLIAMVLAPFQEFAVALMEGTGRAPTLLLIEIAHLLGGLAVLAIAIGIAPESLTAIALAMAARRPIYFLLTAFTFRRLAIVPPHQEAGPAVRILLASATMGLLVWLASTTVLAELAPSLRLAAAVAVGIVAYPLASALFARNPLRDALKSMRLVTTRHSAA